MPGRGIMSEDRFQVLCYEQVDRLDRVMKETVPIHGRGNFPTLNVKLKEFVQIVKNKLKSTGILVRDIRLNGGAASYILGSESTLVFNDYDLIFNVQLKDQSDLQKIKDLVLSSLLDFFPKGINKDRMSLCSLNEAYVNKMVKIFNDADKWSLISLSSVRAKNIELKFADSMRRQFEFSVDSFQIILDSLLTFYEIPHPTMTEHFYPTVDAESVYGNFEMALYHLNNKLIATRNPEEIRGGGLLKYCNLLVRGYLSSEDMDIRLLEKYMCSRFFIDFSNITDQRMKLENYLAAHFKSGEDMLKVDYLKILHFVVSESTICLMGHERRQTLELIDEMIHREMVSSQRALSKRSAKHSEQQSSTAHQTKSNLIIDQVFYGPFSYAMPGVDPSHQYYTVYNYDVNKQNSVCPFCEVCPECG